MRRTVKKKGGVRSQFEAPIKGSYSVLEFEWTLLKNELSRPDQRPPSGRASFALAPDPPEHGHRFMYRAVPECTWGVDFNKAGDRLKRYHCPSGTPPMGPSLQTGST